MSLRDPCKRREYYRERYRKARASGMPAWRANRRTPRGYAKRLADDREFSARAVADGRSKTNAAKYRDRIKPLYKGLPASNSAARLRWLVEKENKNDR
jgi:hypothetical protein